MAESGRRWLLAGHLHSLFRAQTIAQANGVTHGLLNRNLFENRREACVSEMSQAYVTVGYQ
jgi:hypothetical protein